MFHTLEFGCVCRDAPETKWLPIQCNVIIPGPEHTNKQDLIFQNHPDIVSDDFLGDLCI